MPNNSTTPEASQGDTQDNPSSTQQNSVVQKSSQYSQEDVARWKTDSENYKKVQDYFNANRDLVDFAYKYTEDPVAQEIVQRYKSGTLDFKTPENGNSNDDSLENMDMSDKEHLTKIVERLVKERLAPVNEELSSLRKQHANNQIENMAKKYTMDNGYPINFSDVKEDIANLITTGRAVDAETGYKLVMADRWPGLKKQYEEKILDEKRKASMSKYSIPASLNVKEKNKQAKNFAEALSQAEENLGVSLGDALNFK